MPLLKYEMVDSEWDCGVDEMDMVEGKRKSGRS